MMPGTAVRLTGALAGDPHAPDLIERFLRAPTYDRGLCHDLIDLARGGPAYSWPLRRLAILMLEHQILKLPATDADEIAFLFAALAITADPAGPIRTRFTALRRRLERLNRVHAAIAGVETSQEALDDFAQASYSECKLTLARHLFSHEEILARIGDQVRTSTGLKDVRVLNERCVQRERARYLEKLPAFEALILAGLCHRSRIYWVSEDTPSHINGLVEYPLGTIVAVIKPPGSDREFELKRVGLRGRRPWEVVFARDGIEVPPTHRIQGGSMAYYLHWEASATARLAHLYRLIRHDDPPISRTVAVSTIYGVPVNGRECHIVDYFTSLNGAPGDDDTRHAMRRSIEAFRREMRTRILPARNDVELAAQFLGQVAPSQSILAETSSFRLDRLVAWLSPEGAQDYHARVFGETPSRAQAKAFADEILEEMLGILSPPDTPFESHAGYVEAAFAIHANRARADRHYQCAMREIGKFWGTLLGMRSYTYGESFVARNVALKSVWNDGEWTVKILFLDHDGTYLSGQRERDFRPLSALPGMIGDDWHVWGSRRIVGIVTLLRQLYRVDDRAEHEAQDALREEMRRAFAHARQMIREDPRVQACFAPRFVDRFTDWDTMVVSFLNAGDASAAREEWRERTTRWLDGKGYSERLRREHIRGVEQHAAFLAKYAFLYERR